MHVLAGTQERRGEENVKTTIRGLNLEDHQNSSSTRAGDSGGGCGSPGKLGSFWDSNGAGRRGLSKVLGGELRWRRIWESRLLFTPKGRRTTSVLSAPDASPATEVKPSFHLQTRDFLGHISKSITFFDFKGGKSRTDGHIIAKKPTEKQTQAARVSSLNPTPSETGRSLDTDLVIRDGFSEPGTVQLQVNIRQLVQQLLWFEAVFLRVFDFQVAALGTTELLKVEVQHCGQAGSKFLGNHRVIGQFMLLRQARRTRNSYFSGGTGNGWINLQRVPYKCCVSSAEDKHIQKFFYSPFLIQ